MSHTKAKVFVFAGLATANYSPKEKPRRSGGTAPGAAQAVGPQERPRRNGASDRGIAAFHPACDTRGARKGQEMRRAARHLGVRAPVPSMPLPGAAHKKSPAGAGAYQ